MKMTIKGNRTPKVAGITLISLIITIIILLILVAVAISLSINQDGLFHKTNEAVETWNTAHGIEENTIKDLINELENMEKVEVTDNVTISKNPDTANWINSDVTVSLSYNNIPEGYVMQYKVGSGSWTTGNSVKIASNTTVYGRLYNASIDDEIATNSIEISNIDKTVPTAPNGISKTENINSITVQASGGSDVGSGIAGYQYSINGTSWTGTIAEGTSYTFEGIKAGAEVTIYAKTIDKVGLESSTYSSSGSTIEVTDNVTISKNPDTANWINSDVTVSLSYNNIPTGYVIQYKVGSGSWTTGTSVTITNNTTVYGRLYNASIDDEIATNSIEISNIDKTAPTAPTGITSSVQVSTNEVTTSLPNGWDSTKVSKAVNEKGSVTVQASGGTDEGSGIAGYQYSTNGTSWTETIANGSSYAFSGISENTTIYARTVNKAGGLSGDYSKEIVVELRTAPIPVGYTVSDVEGETSIADGLVIYERTEQVSTDEDAITTRNQYVWIPVDDINSMIMCREHGASVTLDQNTLQCQTCGVGTKHAGKMYEQDFTQSDQTYLPNDGSREPAVITGGSAADEYDGDTTNNYHGLGTATAFLSQLDDDFEEMARSVAKYKGFYVSRYEIGEGGSSKQNQIALSAASNSSPMWYGLYNVCRNVTNTIIHSHMIWGSQYDQIMKFTKEKIRYDGTGEVFDVFIGSQERQNEGKVNSGMNSKDKICNIYDLEGSYCEWTVQASSWSYRIARGGNYLDASGGRYYSAFRSGTYQPNFNISFCSSRATLYISI